MEKLPEYVYIISANDGSFYEFNHYSQASDYIRFEKISGVLMICEIFHLGLVRKAKIIQSIHFNQIPVKNKES